MTFSDYVAIATIFVIPGLGYLADYLYGRALDRVALAATTPDPTDDVRATTALRRAKAFVDAMGWIGRNIGRILPLVRRFVVTERPLNPTPTLERVEEGKEP